MAIFRSRRQSDVTQAFRNDPQLQQFLLNDVTPTGRVLGTGSYGSVVEVNYRKLVCAGKKLHEALLDLGNQGVPEMVRRYLRECQLMSSLRHPNITQFLGICFLPETRLPLLVMERLETSLDDLLEHMPNLPLSLKRSILEDVASGLLYLHKMQPPVIHRDLTSNNVLLTSSLVAKITDMGNSRIVDLRPGQIAKTLTKYPGALVYMPPEALDDRHRYGPSLDIFSFGHLALYTITQTFPGDLLAYTFPNPDNPEDVQARNELERREQYIQFLEALIGRLHPDLVQLVKQCLHNVPTRRPSTEELLTRLQGMRGQVEGKYGGPVKLDMVRVRLAKEVQEKDRRVEELMQQQERHEAELEVRDRRVEALRAEVRTKDDQNQQLQEDYQQLECEIAAKVDQVGGLMRQLQTRDKHIEALQTEIQAQKDQLAAKERNNAEALQGKEAEISRLKEALRQLQQTQQQGVQQGPLKVPLQLTWRRGPNMPFGMDHYVQSVVVQGNVYVGGGFADPPDRKHTIMEYNPSSEKWTTLTDYTTRNFAMAGLNNQLVVVGGKGSDEKASKVVGVWAADHKNWTYPYPEMPTARTSCSAVAYNQWLVVAGGRGSQYFSSVEILNANTKVWQDGPPLPIPLCDMKTAIVGDTCYFMGGYDRYRYTEKVYSAFLKTLTGNVSSKKIWKEISGLTCSTPLSIRGSLLSIGGSRSYKAITAIYLYQPNSGDWVKVGDLPSPRYNCTCVVNARGDLLVAGGGPSPNNKNTLDITPIQ